MKPAKKCESSSDELKIIELERDGKINFKPMSDRYGRAEFVFCPIFKYGKLKELYIQPLQQEVENIMYHVSCCGQREFCILSWQHKGHDLPNIWHNFWCKEHKTIAFEVSVPTQCNIIRLEQLSSLQIIFERDDE